MRSPTLSTSNSAVKGCLTASLWLHHLQRAGLAGESAPRVTNLFSYRAFLPSSSRHKQVLASRSPGGWLPYLGWGHRYSSCPIWIRLRDSPFFLSLSRAFASWFMTSSRACHTLACRSSVAYYLMHLILFASSLRFDSQRSFVGILARINHDVACASINYGCISAFSDDEEGRSFPAVRFWLNLRLRADLEGLNLAAERK